MKNYNTKLVKLAKKISEFDYSEFFDDDWVEGAYLIAKDMFFLNDKQINIIIDIIYDNFLYNINTCTQWIDYYEDYELYMI